MKDLKLGVYVITAALPGLARDHLDVVRAALAGGADVIQVRDKEAGTARLADLALEARKLMDKNGSGCLLIVNDDARAALASGADGLHVGQSDMAAAEARAVCGSEIILGVTATTVDEARRAEQQGADYIGASPIFETPSKEDAGAPIGLEGLRTIREAVSIPIVAIGGIDHASARSVLEAGADGLAVISAVAGAPDMEASVRELRRIVDSCGRGR
jgi:thiamine-phosphate pyrophosphorylase